MKTYLPPLLLVASILIGGCADLNSPYYPPSSSGGYYGGGGGYDPYYSNRYDRDRDYARREKRELERERDRLEDERERLERERERQQAYKPPPPPPPRREQCPPGFSPSENKCSPEERRRGCKDIRLPGGLGCVRR